MRIEWQTTSFETARVGHGVEFHVGFVDTRSRPVAFLDGYDWLKGYPECVTILVDEAASSGSDVRGATPMAQSVKNSAPSLFPAPSPRL